MFGTEDKGDYIKTETAIIRSTCIFSCIQPKKLWAKPYIDTSSPVEDDKLSDIELNYQHISGVISLAGQEQIIIGGDRCDSY